ncbi:MAG: DNA polymerase III subunit delta' [Candidatus Omnitrophica bacterium]|nr:DNA polymerase III subunit delta' [Candidatus Omnitrophota bacterium]MDD5238645.1 DNA polymerase III subunit delta' [Candidatus Omnitrophota bacterium]
MSFSAIKGQIGPINILKKYIEQSCLAGGYLFTGPQGIGKKLVAKTLAKTVNCLEAGLDSCDACISCKKIDNNQHPDVHIIEAEEACEIKIEYIRQLQKEINLKPYEAKVKVFIIDDAHNLTAEASNALLKILEEPPKNSLIILISDKQALLFKTIISRCKILKFAALKRAELEIILKEDYSVEKNLAHFLAYFSEGSFGTALKFKDRDIMREKNKIIDSFVLSRKGGFENLSIQNREEVSGYFNILATWFRDIYLIKVGLPHSEIINFDRRDELLRSMSEFSFSDLNEILSSISESILSLGQNMNVKLVLHNFSSIIQH